MSVDAKEIIYDLIPPYVPPAEARRRHKSKFSESVQQETKYLKSANRTMGPATVSVNRPDQYLKKHSKETKTPLKASPAKKEATLSSSIEKKPHVPRAHERPQMATKTEKDFLKTNAISTITAIPKKPKPKYIDTPSGDTHLLEESGLIPQYINKKTYGKVPDYLETRRKEMTEAQLEYEKYIRASFEREQMVQLTEEERQGILDGLKANWDKLHHDYQGLSVVTDTPAKKARKERMEGQMKQLEKDIEQIEKHPIIYVENTATAY